MAASMQPSSTAAGKCRTVSIQARAALIRISSAHQRAGRSLPGAAKVVLMVTQSQHRACPDQPTQARALCHEVWYVEVPERVRRSRLVGRHRHYGRSKAQASARVTVGVDAENAHVVASTRARADVVVRLALSEDEYS